QFIHDHPRPPFMRAPDRTWPWQVLGDLVAWRDLAPIVGRKYYAHEYTARLPWLAAPLWAAALWLGWSRRLAAARRRRARELWLVMAAAAVLVMGNFAPWAPWSLLQRLPVLRDLRVPSRHLVLVAFAMALLAGFVLDQAGDWMEERWGAVGR